MPTRKSSSQTSSKSSGKAQQGAKGGAAKSASVSGAIPPYGVPIQEAIARGDKQEMRKVAASARKWLKDVQAALDQLDKASK
ncbi:MAG TPA: DUF1843 domain-containing protein [Pyrinomonadaceae bacterium]|nr:DUF1843 domain-containing protein [Pyrinomonadaceae bacterium]